MTHYTANDITLESVKMNNDVNGNPRYYTPAYMFKDKQGEYYRPKHCRKYTGKRYGAGWVFCSYSLENDIRDAIEGAAA